MAENITLGSFATLQNSSIIATLNANNTLIENAFADCLSLTGTSPNSMQANLDMNNFNIINLPAGSTLNSPVRLVDLTASSSSLSPSLFALLAVANNFTNINTFSNTTQSTTTGTGAVVIAGGLGVAKNLFVGGSLNITGSFNISTIFGGTAAGSILTLASTSNVAPAGDSISVQGTRIFFKSATGGSTFGDYNNTTASTWTFSADLKVVGNLSVTGSSSTFSFSGADLGLGTTTPVHSAGFASLTLNGSTGGNIAFTRAGSIVAEIFTQTATAITFTTVSAAGQLFFGVNSAGTITLDYNSTNANAWTANKFFVTGLTTTATLTVGTGGAAGTAAINGAVGANALQVVGNGGANLTIDNNGTGHNLYDASQHIFRTTGGVTLLDYNVTTANTWTFNAQSTTGFLVKGQTNAAGDFAPQCIIQNNDSTGGFSTGAGYLVFQKSRNTTTVLNGDAVGTLIFEPYVTTSGYLAAATISVAVNGTVTGTVAPTDMSFAVCSSTTPTTQMLRLSGNLSTILTNANIYTFQTAAGSGICDYNSTNANAWTFRGSAGVVIDTAVGAMVNVTSANTGSENSLQVKNSGTVATAGTAATIYALLTGVANSYIAMSAAGGAGPRANILSGPGLTSGILLSSNVGPIIVQANTTLQFQSGGSSVGDFGLTTAGGWTLLSSVNPALVVTGTVTGGNMLLRLQNAGTAGTAGTGCNITMNVSGLANGSINILANAGTTNQFQIVVNSGYTAGALIQANAGSITLSTATQNIIHVGGVAYPAPSTQAGTSFTADIGHYCYITTNAGAVTVTMPSAASAGIGQIFVFKQTGAGAVSSASSNIVPLAGGAAGTAITAGAAKWARLQSDGTNWIIIESN